MAPKREIIEISSSSEDNWDSADDNGSLEESAMENRVINLDSDERPSYDHTMDPRTQGLDPQDHYERCLHSVIECFPDMSRDHVQKLYADHLQSIDLDQADGAVETLISRILDAGTYPKELDRLKAVNELKRKSDDARGVDKEAAKWKNNNPHTSPHVYAKACRSALQEVFPMVPARFIDDKFRGHGHLYGAFLAIADAERAYSYEAQKPYAKLKCRRYTSGLSFERLMRRAQAEGHDDASLRSELEAAKRKKEEDDRIHEEQAKKAAEIVASEQDERERGEVMECGCCFDTIPMSKITRCNAEIAHFFCHDCARMNAESDIGANKFGLQCMDGSSCKASFSRSERAKFLDIKKVEKLENLEQEAAIRLAMVGSVDFVNCPFCHYGHICPPIEQDKEFRCHYPECKEISCRLCKEKSHIPLSCDESKKESGISERHVIEEARTEALIRVCTKCKVRILKEEGCNKVVCTTCRSIICDYCGRDISSEGYGHFEGQNIQPPTAKSNSKCPLYDKSGRRKDDQIDAAEREAKENIRRENPKLSEDDLKIRFSEKVQESSFGDGRQQQYPFPRHPGGIQHYGIPQVPNYYGVMQGGPPHAHNPVPPLNAGFYPRPPDPLAGRAPWEGPYEHNVADMTRRTEELRQRKQEQLARLNETLVQQNRKNSDRLRELEQRLNWDGGRYGTVNRAPIQQARVPMDHLDPFRVLRNPQPQPLAREPFGGQAGLARDWLMEGPNRDRNRADLAQEAFGAPAQRQQGPEPRNRLNA